MKINHKVVYTSILLLISGCASKPTVEDSERFSREMIECAHRNLMFGVSFGVNQITKHAVNNSNSFLKMATRVTSESFVSKESPIIKQSVEEDFLEWVQITYGSEISLETAWNRYESSCLSKVKPWMDVLIPKKKN